MNRSSLTLTFAVLFATARSAYGDGTHNPTTGHWYQLTAPGLTWTEAQAAAVALGGNLVTINDDDENDWLFAQFGNAAGALWIGLYQPPGSAEPASGWVWASGEPVMFTNWDSGEPNNFSGPEDYAEMGPLPSGLGKWNDTQVHDVRPGIVERPCPPGVNCPTVSEWGLGVLSLLLVTAGTVVVRRRVVGMIC